MPNIPNPATFQPVRRPGERAHKTYHLYVDEADNHLYWERPDNTRSKVRLEDDAQSGGQGGTADIVNGNNYVTVTFSPALASADWHFTRCYVENTTDDPVLAVWPTVLTSKLTTGFTIMLNVSVDSENYDLRWAVALD